jgi:hypothetical protein
MQLTSSYPANWADPQTNIDYAVENYILPAWAYWRATYGYQGDDLVRCIAAEYNAGRGGAEQGHAEGDVDLYTTNHYADRCLMEYKALVAGQMPS